MAEIELQLLTKDEADAEPVGRKRKKPNQVSVMSTEDLVESRST